MEDLWERDGWLTVLGTEMAHCIAVASENFELPFSQGQRFGSTQLSCSLRASRNVVVILFYTCLCWVATAFWKYGLSSYALWKDEWMVNIECISIPLISTAWDIQLGFHARTRYVMALEGIWSMKWWAYMSWTGCSLVVSIFWLRWMVVGFILCGEGGWCNGYLYSEKTFVCGSKLSLCILILCYR